MLLQTLMNVNLVLMTATLMPAVTTQLEALIVHVYLDLKAMELPAQVSTSIASHQTKSLNSVNFLDRY